MIQRVFSKYNLNRRFASDLLQFCLQLQEQFCNKMFPGEKNTYRKLRGRIPEDVYFSAILLNGANPNLLYDLFDGKEVGTRFFAKGGCV